MSGDNFHLIVQHRNGYWRVATHQNMTAWQRRQNKTDWRRANRTAKHVKAPEFDTLTEALDYSDDKGYTQFGHVVINYEEYYG